MKVILDTNVFVSGVFFTGPPHMILEAWRDKKISLVISLEILEEYRRVGNLLSEKFPGVDLNPLLDLVTIESELVTPPEFQEGVCQDPDDDKFIACALASATTIIVTGDKHLLEVSGYGDIRIVKPRVFFEEFLRKRN